MALHPPNKNAPARSISGRPPRNPGRRHAPAAAGRGSGADDVFGDFSRHGKDEGGAGADVAAAKGQGAAGPGEEGAGYGAHAGLEGGDGEGAQPAGVTIPAGVLSG